jgi:hypothetical protein
MANQITNRIKDLLLNLSILSRGKIIIIITMMMMINREKTQLIKCWFEGRIEPLKSVFGINQKMDDKRLHGETPLLWFTTRQ